VKIVKLLGTVFVVVGVLLLAGGFLSYRYTRRFLTHSTVASGEVINLVFQASSDFDSRTSSTGTYHPVIRFETAGRETIEFMSNTGNNPPSHRKGDTVTVRYDPNDPYTARVDSWASLWLLALIPASLGLLLASTGGIMIGIMIRSAGLMKYLQDFGRDITTEFQSVSLDTSVTVNGRHPYRIYAQWHDPTQNKIVTFKSKAIWFNPVKYIQGKEIEVRIDPNNPRKYFMDTSFLPEAE